MKLLALLILSALMSSMVMAEQPAPVVNCTASATQDGESVFSISQSFVESDAKTQSSSNSTTTKKTVNMASITASSDDGYKKSLTVEFLVTNTRTHRFGRDKQTTVEAQTMELDLTKDAGPWTITKRIGDYSMDFICTDARVAR